MPGPRRRAPARRKAPRKNNQVVRRVARAEAKKVFNRQVESKVFDGASVNTGTDFNGSVVTLWDSPAGVAITQGAGEQQYVGAIIKPTYLMMRFSAASGTAGDPTNIMRVIILQDVLTGVPTGANVLEVVGVARAPLSPLDLDFDKSFRVLLDRTFTLNTVSEPVKAMKFKIGMRQLRPISFSDAAGTYERGGIYMLVISDSSVAAPSPTWTASWRWHYKDA